VAGYDLSRLMCGSYGCLGVLTEASIEDNSFWQRLRDLQLQRLAGTVEAILRRLGFPLTAVADAHLCCGSAGTSSITHLYQHPRRMS